MKNSQLEALIIDHELGELPEEVSSLLDAYLDTDKKAQEEAENIREALDMTRQTVNHSPDLFRAPANNEASIMGTIMVLLTSLNTRNVAFAMAIILSGTIGFFLKGMYQPQSAISSPVAGEIKTQERSSSADKSIWASYQIDDGGNPVLLASNSSQTK